MKHLLIVLLPILLMGCESERKARSSESERKARSSESERKARSSETDGKATGGETDADEMGGENKRKARVQSLVQQLADKSLESRQDAYVELRDTFVRKRDIPELTQEIARNANPEVTRFLRELTTYMEGKWRLPDKGWTDDNLECFEPYFDKSETFGSVIVVCENLSPRSEPIILMDVCFPDKAERSPEVINLILTLEPESLILSGGGEDIAFLGPLTNLVELSLQNTKLVDLKQLKVLPNLRRLELKNTKVTDLTPLKEMPNLRLLYLERDNAIDLTPLKGTSVTVIRKRSDR